MNDRLMCMLAALVLTSAPRALARAEESPPAADSNADAATLRGARGVAPTLRSFTESAALQTPEMVDVDVAYRVDFAATRTDFGEPLALHRAELLAGYGVNERIEARFGWHLFAFSDDGYSGRQGGLGNPYLDAKFALDLPDAGVPHALALRGRVEFGFARVFGPKGVGVGATALYTARLGEFVLDANGGVEFNTAQSPAYFSVPLSARGTLQPLPWLDVFAEFVETLRLDYLRQSGTALAGGVGFLPIDTVSVSLTGGVGLSTTLPSGYFQLSVAALSRPPERPPSSPHAR